MEVAILNLFNGFKTVQGFIGSYSIWTDMTLHLSRC